MRDEVLGKAGSVLSGEQTVQNWLDALKASNSKVIEAINK